MGQWHLILSQPTPGTMSISLAIWKAVTFLRDWRHTGAQRAKEFSTGGA
tara:strand:+ start:658 stop:804 length:147 start_codon:yes stop_codon:yes gene_type:complete